MRFNVPPEKSFNTLRFFARNLAIWPLQKHDKAKVFKQIWFLFCLVMDILLLVPTAYSLYVNIGNISLICYSWAEFIGFCECVSIMIYTKYHNTRLQALFDLAESQLDRKKPKVIQNYATLYVFIFSIIMSVYSIIVIIYFIIDKPKTESTTLFTSAVYPFDIESFALKVFLYCNQAFVLCHTSITAIFDGIVVLLILMCHDSLKVLEDNFKNAKNYGDLKSCIKEHNRVLQTIKEVDYITKFMILRTIISFITGVLACGLSFVNNTSTLHRCHQVATMVLVYSRLALCAESAHNMSSASEDIENTIYSTCWYDDDRKIIAAKTFIIFKCQSLPIIQFDGLMSALNRKFLGTILGTTISYFMTLKTIIGRED